MVDSKEFFTDLALRAGVSELTIGKLRAREWSTQSGLAYAVLGKSKSTKGSSARSSAKKGPRPPTGSPIPRLPP
eukprot:336135-Heterocapsa_arctica.AAC.1